MESERKEILDRVGALCGVTPENGESFEATLIRALSVMECKCESFTSHEIELERKITEVVNVLMNYAKLDYSATATVGLRGDIMDGLSTGINMLGEELKSSTISSKEKDILLKEIHHRVKNNLQIISSLLNLQSDQILDEFAKEKYKVSRDRIQTMALVHEKLYESDNFSRIDFGEYVQSLTRSLNNSYNPDMERIQVEVDLKLEPGDGLFRIETAIPCGLILNELLSNSFKYAFPGNRKGVIKVHFGRENPNSPEHVLRVEDDGVGLAEDFDITTTVSLGMQLVHMLSDQLSGKLNIERSKGVSASLYFSEN